jgi:hypothetical protein
VISETATRSDVVGGGILRVVLFAIPLVMATGALVVGWGTWIMLLAAPLAVIGAVLVWAEVVGWRDKVVWYECDGVDLRFRTASGGPVQHLPVSGIRRIDAVRSPRLGEQYLEVETGDGRRLEFWHYLLPQVGSLNALLSPGAAGASVIDR